MSVIMEEKDTSNSYYINIFGKKCIQTIWLLVAAFPFLYISIYLLEYIKFHKTYSQNKFYWNYYWDKDEKLAL